MPNCLPSDILDFALLWRPKGVIKRRYNCNGDPTETSVTDREAEFRLPTYTWVGCTGPVTYEPYDFHIKSLVTRFGYVDRKGKSRHAVRFPQNEKSENGKIPNRTLSPSPLFAPSDCSAMQWRGQGLHEIRPMTRTLAFKMRIVDKLNIRIAHGLSILQFKAVCIQVLLSKGIL